MRNLFFAAAAVSLLGCNQQAVAPEVESGTPTIGMQTDGLWQDMSGVRVEGFASHMERVTVNGNEVQVADGRFATELTTERGVTLIETIGTDERGDDHVRRQGVLSGSFKDPSATVEDALTIRLNRSGIQDATNLVSNFIDPVAISNSVTALNPVYDDSYGVLGWDAVNVRADLVNLGFSDPIITPDPKAGVMEVEVRIPNVEVHVNVTGDVVGIDFDQDAWVGCDNAIVTANITVGVVDGELDIQLIAPSVELDGFWYDVSLIPGDIESYILVDTIRGTVEDLLVGKIDEMLPSLLGDTLGDLDISFDMALLDKNVSIDAFFADAHIDQAGIQLTTDVAVLVEGQTVKPWVGYLGSPTANPQPSMADDLGVSVSDNLLNAVLFQVWKGGMLQLSLDSTKGELEPSMLAQLGATDSAQVYVDAQLPPVFVEKNGEAQLQLTELAVRINTPGGSNGEFIDLSITAFVDLQVAIVNGNLTLDLGTPELLLDVRDSDWGADNNAITNLLADQIPIEALLVLLGDIEFPLPSLAGISISQGDAWRETSGVYTTVTVNL